MDEKYVCINTCALPGGLIQNKVTVSARKLRKMNHGVLPDNEYLKENFAAEGTPVDDEDKVDEYRNILMAARCPFHQGASEATLKKLVDRIGDPDEEEKEVEELSPEEGEKEKYREILRAEGVSFNPRLGLKKLKIAAEKVQGNDPLD